MLVLLTPSGLLHQGRVRRHLREAQRPTGQPGLPTPLLGRAQRPPLGWDSQQLLWSGGPDLQPLPTVAAMPSWFRVQSWGHCADMGTEA